MKETSLDVPVEVLKLIYKQRFLSNFQALHGVSPLFHDENIIYIKLYITFHQQRIQSIEHPNFLCIHFQLLCFFNIIFHDLKDHL